VVVGGGKAARLRERVTLRVASMVAARLVAAALCAASLAAHRAAWAGPPALFADDTTAGTPASTAPSRARKKKRKPKAVPAPDPSPSAFVDEGAPASAPADALPSSPPEPPEPPVASSSDAKSPAPEPTPEAATGSPAKPKPAVAAAPAAAIVAVTVAPAKTPSSAVASTATPAVSHATPPQSSAPAPEPPSATPALKIGGSAILWYYQPFGVEGVKNDFELYDTRITVEADWNVLGFFFEPHFRDTRLRSYYDGPVWLQQGYGFVDLDTTVFKLGKIYSRLGLFWDNSFYGNIAGYDGLKLAPEYGASVEGTLGHDAGLRYWLQFFPLDGRTNVSLTDRDTVSVPGARRRNEAVVRAEPIAKLGEGSEFDVALSGEYFLADIPGDAEDVVRLGVDAKLTVGGFSGWGELIRQEGRSVTDFPFEPQPATATTPAVPGRASAHVDYALVGAEFTQGNFTARCNFSLGNYEDVSTLEWLVVPGIGYSVNEHVTLLGEFALWTRVESGESSLVDRSLNLTLSAWF
jgi:hypothetical protein